MDFSHLSLPLTNPVIVFGIILLIILFSPLVLKKFRIPGIVGLIISGMIVGPNGLNLIAHDSSTNLFSTVGLLYIMFIAGLEIDFHQFNKYKSFSLFYGIALFILPFSIGFLICYFVLNMALIASIMISLIFSTNTLVSYPIVKRLSISSNFAVVAAVSAAVIADTAILISLGFFKSIAINGFDFISSMILVAKFIFYISIILYLFPKLTVYFFKTIKLDNYYQFTFVFSLLLLSAILSYILEIEPIIGAFITGVSLNRLIPTQSVLMGRIEFIGNTIFIPFFLVFVGFLIDIKSLYTDINTWYYTMLFIAIAFISKYLSIFISGKLFKIDNQARGLIYGLNLSQAGATVAIALVVFQLGLLTPSILNSFIILVLISCITSSFITERYGRLIAISSSNLTLKKPDNFQRILLPYSNPRTVDLLLDLAISLKELNNEPIFPLSVILDSENTEEQILRNFSALQHARLIAESVNIKLQIATRVDTNVSDGISRAIKEIVADIVILGWNFKSNTFGSLNNKDLEHLLNITDSSILVSKIVHPINLTKNIYVYIPENAELELGCTKWVNLIKLLSKYTGSNVILIGFETTLTRISNYIKIAQLAINYKTQSIIAYNELISISKTISDLDMLIVINSRPKGISYNSTYSVAFNRAIRSFTNQNVIVLFPEQSSVYSPDLMYSNSDVLDASLIDENISIYYKIKNFIRDIFISK